MTVPKILAQLTVPVGGYTFAVEAEELLTDGTMDASGTAAWTPANDATFTKETSSPAQGTRWGKVLCAGTANPLVYQADVCEVGVEYTLTGYAKGDGTAHPRIYNQVGSTTLLWTGTSGTDWQAIDVTFTATGTRLDLFAWTSTLNEFCGFDGLSLTRSTPLSVTVTSGAYDTVLEFCSSLETALGAIDSTFGVLVSAAGIVSISSDTAWTVDFSTTSDGLETLLGFAGTETVATSAGSYVLTATSQHRYGFYPDVGVRYPIDRRRKALRSQDTADGNVANYTDDTVHRYRELSFSLLSLEETSEGGSDGSKTWTNVTLRDFWEYALDRPFRFYASASTGTVAAPGTRGTDYDLLRFHEMDTFAPQNVADADSWAYWDITLPCKVVTS